MKFDIKKDFMIDDQPVKLISGALHYFRIMPEMWEHSLYNLKAMGCNTVETYVPWNMHEPQKGTFDFEGLANIEQYLELAQSMGLYIILRPAAYICAEWDFGGLPAWLLKDRNLRVRSQDEAFLKHVDDYYAELLPRVTRFQTTQGGSLLMMQVENEYGSYSEDHTYLRKTADIMRKYGVEVPLFTSDGGWPEVLNSGALGSDGILATANFGSDAETNFKHLDDYHIKHGLEYPLMCMEFWDGWFNNWDREIIRRDPQETANEVVEVLKRGSINFYMFQGGTNFGFYSGSSDFDTENIAQITSYDYDAPLTEWGAPTEKYYAIQEAIQKTVPEAITFEPKIPELGAYDALDVKEKTSLFPNLDKFRSVHHDYTLNMEAIDQNFGYTLYETTMKGKRHVSNFKVVDASDRLQVYVNDTHKETQYNNEIGTPIAFDLTQEDNNLKVLVENLSRNNYGPKVVANTQYKGIRGGVIEDIHYMSHWNHYAIDFETLDRVDYSLEHDHLTPSFYTFEINVEDPKSTFIDTRQYGKGLIFINGFNLGRYWNAGPTQYLYAPAPLWKQGLNTIVVFETEGINIERMVFNNEPIYGFKKNLSK